MKIYDWMLDRENDDFIIVDECGTIVYDARKTTYDPKLYICNSLVVDIYTWNGLTVLAI